MEFVLSGAIQLVSSSLAGRRPATNRSATRFNVEILVCDRSETRSANSWRAGRRSASVLLANWIAPDRTSSITLSSSLAARWQVVDQFASWIA